ERELDRDGSLQPSLGDGLAIGGHGDRAPPAHAAAVVFENDDQLRLAPGQRVLCRERRPVHPEGVVDEGRHALAEGEAVAPPPAGGAWRAPRWFCGGWLGLGV